MLQISRQQECLSGEALKAVEKCMTRNAFLHGSPGERRSPRAYYLGLTDIRQAATLSDIEIPFVKLMSGQQLAACLEVPLKTEVPNHTQCMYRAGSVADDPRPAPDVFFLETAKKRAKPSS